MLPSWAVCNRHCPQNKYINKPVQLLDKWAALWFSASSGGFLKGITSNVCNKGSVSPFYKRYRRVSIKTIGNPFVKVALKCYRFTIFFCMYIKWV